MRQRVSDAEFSDAPGVYVVYADDPRPLYVGVAATQSIKKRWRNQHLKPRSGGSALRRTLGVHLGLVAAKLRTAESRYYPPEVEEAITRFLESCQVEFHPAPDAAAARAREAELIAALQPTLNVRRASIEARAKAALADGLGAVKREVAVDSRGYVLDLADNLLPDISRADIAGEFAAGAGNELEAKMLAPWSSSALAVNSFAPWRDKPEQLRLGGVGGFSGRFAFEAKCDHGVRGERPHLDVLLHRDGEVVGVESKCLEYTRTHPKPVVSDAYWVLRECGDARATSRWFAVLEQVASFARLDAYQLVKHYLGLVYSYPSLRRTLVYLYWEPTNNDEPLIRDHRAEIARFAALVAGDATCRFVALAYGEHWRELDTLADAPPWLPQHLRLLRLRYGVAI